MAAGRAGHWHPRHHQCFCHVSGLMHRFQSSVSQSKPRDRFLCHLRHPLRAIACSPPLPWALSSPAPRAELPQPTQGQRMNILSPESNVSSQGQPPWSKQCPVLWPGNPGIPSGRHGAQLCFPVRQRHLLGRSSPFGRPGPSFPLLFLTSLLQCSQQFDAFSPEISVIFLLQGATASCDLPVNLNCCFIFCR